MSLLERFRTGGASHQGTARAVNVIYRWIAALILLWLGSWLLSWHFARALGLAFVVTAALIVNMRTGRE